MRLKCWVLTICESKLLRMLEYNKPRINFICILFWKKGPIRQIKEKKNHEETVSERLVQVTLTIQLILIYKVAHNLRNG